MSVLAPATIGVAQPSSVLAPALDADNVIIRAQIDPVLLQPRDDVRARFDASILIEQTGDLGELRNVEVLRWPAGVEPTLDVAGMDLVAADDGPTRIQSVDIGERAVLPDFRTDEWAIVSAPGDAAQPITMQLPQVKYYAPDRMFFVDESSDADGAVLREAQLFFSIQSVPLPWLSAEGAYGEDLIVGLDPVEPEAMGLPTPTYVVRLTTEGAQLSGPSTLTFNELGQETRVALRAHDHRHPIAAKAYMNNSEQRLDLSVTPRIADLRLNVSSSSLLALGLQPVSFTVERHAEDGHPLVADRDVELRAIGNGILFDGEGHMQVARGASSVQGRLRSIGVARAASFYVVEGNVRSEPFELRFDFPWLLLLIAFLGGALGATVHRGFRRVEGPIVRDAVTGMLVGVLAVAAIIVGVPAFGIGIAVTSMVLTGAGAFVVAATAGYGGRYVLDRLLAAMYGPPGDATA